LDLPDDDELLTLVGQALRDDGLSITVHPDARFIVIHYNPAGHVYHTLAVVILSYHILLVKAANYDPDGDILMQHLIADIPVEDPSAFIKLKDLCHKQELKPRHRNESPMNRLRIWWIPQVPGQAFRRDVKDYVEAKLLLDTLGAYDLFQLDNNIKPDFANVGGLEEWDSEERVYLDWHPSEQESLVLEQLFGSDIGYSDDPLDQMTLEQVRQFQEELNKVKT
jgi:hypothetical protein